MEVRTSNKEWTKEPKRFIKGNIELVNDPADFKFYNASIIDTMHSVLHITNIMWYHRIEVKGKTEKEAKKLRKIIMKELNKQHELGNLDGF